jgi:hypothetical protein
MSVNWAALLLWRVPSIVMKKGFPEAIPVV